jgi:flagellar basal-body rod protein FlgG
MNGAFYIGATGLDAQQRALDVIANNIANINTPAFKRSAYRFSELVATQRDDAQRPQVQIDQIAALAGVSADATHRVWTQGDLKQTGAQLDVAIDGDGFFEVLGPDGQIRLWRGGTLKVNEDGLLATSDGAVLRSMITVPRGASALSIANDGEITTVTDTTTGPERIGQLDIVTVEDKAGLAAMGNGYYESADATGIQSVAPGQDGSGTIVQGALEGSNVELSDQMVTLLLLQRAYAANAQVVQAGDQLMSVVNNLRR